MNFNQNEEEITLPSHQLLTNELVDNSEDQQEIQGRETLEGNTGHQRAMEYEQVEDQQNPEGAEFIPSNESMENEKCVLTWGTFKDILFFAVLLVYMIVSNGPLPPFAKVWLSAQIFLYGCRMQELVKIGLRIMMATWGLLQVITGPWKTLQFVYVCININEFWTVIPIMCMGFFSCALIICFSTSVFVMKSSQFISRYIVGVYKKMLYKRKINELCSMNLAQEENECSICLESNGQVCVQECGHKFHPNCLKQWLDQHNSCPVCRRLLY